MRRTKLSRRHFLSTAGAGLCLPFIPRRGNAADVDVVIIGAGAAGLAAARVFMDTGIEFQLIEAKNRIGGRAFTDTRSFGKPFDLGCTFQHQARANPLVKYAKRNGFDIGPVADDSHSRLQVDGRQANDRDHASLEAQERRIEAALSKAGKAEKDISFLQAASKVAKSKWDPMIYKWLYSGAEADEISVMDWWNGADGEDYICPAGFGTLVAHAGKKVPVHLGVAAQTVDWSGRTIKVTTNKGTIRASQCLVTVSNGVLLNESIAFKPALNERMALLQGIPMAHYITIGLRFKRRKVLPTRKNAFFQIWNKNGIDLSCVADIAGSGITRVNAHGNLAKDLEREGKRGAIDFAVSELRKSLGAKSVPDPVAATASAWGRDPHVMGTWSVARPGFGNRRHKLAEPIEDRLHFAGEACHEDMFTTCGGAWLSGQEIARDIVEEVE